MKLLNVLLLFMAIPLSLSAAEKSRLHINAMHGFKVAVPDGWADVELEGRVVWHVASNGGTDQPDCGVIVTKDPSFSGMTSLQYIGTQSKEKLKAALGLSFENVHIGVWEPAGFELGGQPALHFVYTGVLDGKKQTTFGLQTVRSGRLYSFFCNAPALSFPPRYTDFLGLADTFSFLSLSRNP